MRCLALLGVLVATVALADDHRGRFERFCSRSAQGRTSRGLLCDDLAFFEFAPTSGVGMGTACACTTPTGAKGEVMTFARASSAWCTADDYTLVSCSTNQPRVMRGRGPTSPLGIYVEELASTNSILQNRDLSNAAFTKTSMTCTKTATGADNVANSASTCTATGASATVTQAVVRASAANATSLYIRRRTGTGAIAVTRDNGTTWNTITSSVTTSWKRVTCLDAEGCMGGRCIVVADMCATSANPTVGVRLTTSGDAVDIDLVQNESRYTVSSPITSAGSAGTRASEASPYLTLPVPLSLFGSMSVGVLTTMGTAVGAPIAAWDSNTDFVLGWYSGSAVETAQDLGCAFRPPAGLVSVGAGTFHPGMGVAPLSCSSNPGVARRVCMAGMCATAATGGDITNVTRVYVGAQALSGQPFNGVLSSVCLDGTYNKCGPANSRVYPANNPIAWLGDSITAAVLAAPTRPPYSLQLIVAPRSDRFVFNAGFAGDNVAAMKVRWDTSISAQGFGTLIFLGGVNDLRTGTSAATTYATAVQILDDARARGMTVVPVSVTPWGNWVDWNASRQTQTLAYNALLSAWATANGQTYIDAYTPLSAGGGSPEDLAAAYDSGDGLHPNSAGSLLLAQTVSVAFP